jgi:hypothetical protein
MSLLNKDFYRANYEDLEDLNDDQLEEHFLDFGLKEGRRFNPAIDLKEYRRLNPDLAELDDDNDGANDDTPVDRPQPISGNLDTNNDDDDDDDNDGVNDDAPVDRPQPIGGNLNTNDDDNDDDADCNCAQPDAVTDGLDFSDYVDAMEDFIRNFKKQYGDDDDNDYCSVDQPLPAGNGFNYLKYLDSVKNLIDGLSDDDIDGTVKPSQPVTAPFD